MLHLYNRIIHVGLSRELRKKTNQNQIKNNRTILPTIQVESVRNVVILNSESNLVSLRHHVLLTPQMLHCITFAFAVLGFVYNSLAGKALGTYLGIVSVGKSTSECFLFSVQKHAHILKQNLLGPAVQLAM